jgi:DNA-directed RNA polymerase specialized sigma24 family protein
MPGKNKISTTEEPSPFQKQYEAVNRAKVAAENGDAVGMVTALFESYALDGLFNYIKKKHPTLHRDDIDSVIAESVDVTRAYISDGKKFKSSLLGYLWRTARNKSFDLVKKRPLAEIDTPADEIDEFANAEVQRSKNRLDAFKIARSMLPNLGGENIRRVMEYTIEAIEKDFEITVDDICEALDLSSEVVRQSRSRGFRRLKRLFAEQGYLIDAFEDDVF